MKVKGFLFPVLERKLVVFTSVLFILETKGNLINFLIKIKIVSWILLRSNRPETEILSSALCSWYPIKNVKFVTIYILIRKWIEFPLFQKACNLKKKKAWKIDLLCKKKKLFPKILMMISPNSRARKGEGEIIV